MTEGNITENPGFSELVLLANKVKRQSVVSKERKIEKIVKKIRELASQFEGLRSSDLLEQSHLLESALLIHIPRIIKENFRTGTPVAKFFELFYCKRDEMENSYFRLFQATNSKHPPGEIEILKEAISRQKQKLISILNNAPVGIPQMIIEICLYAVQKPIFLK
ncbi:MAG: hypothetical protein UT05_C0007G0027 [Parcubacteria group bacterium GW2011_GWF2_38_76]|nr:MAG: hypothetical protein UT05_C0007G0027 [Parcubacteria group bacterium GW2011_GWF2_38_76]HBM46097.1 hypothetical protein [Patescibacteria group bacterium]